MIQVGELCNKFTNEFRHCHNQIEFRDIIGLRNVVVHGYGALCYEDIFTIVKEDIEKLMKQYKDILVHEYNYENIDVFLDNYYNSRKFDDIDK